MYFGDLTPYVYGRETHSREFRVVNIGWLERGHEFQTGPVEQHLVDKLAAFCCHSVNQTRGWHRCDLCEEPPAHQTRVTVDGKMLWLGSAEIRLEGRDGIVYAAPNLILHYVTAHEYRPPDEFLAALKHWEPSHELRSS